MPANDGSKGVVPANGQRSVKIFPTVHMIQKSRRRTCRMPCSMQRIERIWFLFLFFGADSAELGISPKNHHN
jgi:hypothetical protein